MKLPELDKKRLNLAKHCIVVNDTPLCKFYGEKYGRKIGIKVFDLDTIKKPEDFLTAKWGDDPVKGKPRKNTTIWEATQIQNILAMNELATRIYGLETVSVGDKLCPAQIIEWIESEEETTIEMAEEVYRKAVKLGEKYGFGIEHEDVSDKDVIGGKLVDTQTFAFTKPYAQTVEEIYNKQGKYGVVYYQDVPELGLASGPRKSLDRIKYLGLEQVDFKGKIVLDFGSAGGFFSRYADNHGAMRVLGIDLEAPVEAAQHMANYLGNWNIDYRFIDINKAGKNLMELIKCHRGPDIAFFLSMNYHVGLPEWLSGFNTVIFEDNGKESRKSDTLGKPWIDWYKDIKLVGHGKDHGDKPCYILNK